MAQLQPFSNGIHESFTKLVAIPKPHIEQHKEGTALIKSLVQICKLLHEILYSTYTFAIALLPAAAQIVIN